MSATSDGKPPAPAGTDGNQASEAARLERLVTLGLLARGVESVLDTWLRRGKVGKTSPAGDARTAIIGASLAMQPRDMIFGTARDLPAALARGISLPAVFQQALGVQGDPALGRALPGAVRDLGTNVTLSDSSPAAHLVHAAGFGQAAELDARLNGDSGNDSQEESAEGSTVAGDRVALAFMGSGAQANGEVHAAFNFAAVSRARVIFLARGPLAGEVPLVNAAPAWGIHAVAVDGYDAMAVYSAVQSARVRALAGLGPTLVDARHGVVPMDGVDDSQTRDARRLQMIGDWTARRAEVIERLETDIAQAAQLALGTDATPTETLAQHLFE